VTLTLNRPWSNICTVHRLIILDICAKLFVNPTRDSKEIERTRNTVIQCLILNCDLDLEPTLVKHKHCTSSHHTWHLCKVICKTHQEFKRYRADMKYSHTMFNLKLWPWPWPDLSQTYTLHIVSSYLTFRIKYCLCVLNFSFFIVYLRFRKMNFPRNVESKWRGRRILAQKSVML